MNISMKQVKHRSSDHSVKGEEDLLSTEQDAAEIAEDATKADLADEDAVLKTKLHLRVAATAVVCRIITPIPAISF